MVLTLVMGLFLGCATCTRPSLFVHRPVLPAWRYGIIVAAVQWLPRRRTGLRRAEQLQAIEEVVPEDLAERYVSQLRQTEEEEEEEEDEEDEEQAMAVDIDTPLAGPRVLTSPFTLRVCGILVLVVAAFSGTFRALEGWSVIDSLYFTTTTLATIGFGDLTPTRPITRALASVVAMAGIGLLSGLVSAVVGEWIGDDGGKRNWAQRVPNWALLSVLLGGGVLGIKLLDMRQRWNDCLYLVIGAMTTAGLGDVVPSTQASKLFLALYSPLAVVMFARVVGALALRPLHAARRLAQRKVLERYGGTLTQQKLNELTAGPLVRRLDLSVDGTYCTRDQYTLLTLVLQGKVTEEDISECRAAFQQLDETGRERISIVDLELVKRRKRRRIEPKLRQKLLKRLANALLEPPLVLTAQAIRTLDEQLRLERERRTALMEPLREGVEAFFPFLGDARRQGDLGEEPQPLQLPTPPQWRGPAYLPPTKTAKLPAQEESVEDGSEADQDDFETPKETWSSRLADPDDGIF
jgi:hypothetical protein